MAIAIVNRKQTGSAAAGTLLITSALPGDLLVQFICTTGVLTPKGKDNISGEAGWVTNPTKSPFSAGTNSVWMASKIAVGGETELNPSAGTIQGITYFELSGASTMIDTIVFRENAPSAATVTSPAVTTTDPGDVLLAAVGAVTGSGIITAWTPASTMTNFETASTRCMGGSFIPGVVQTAAEFTANWSVAHTMGMLVVAIKPLIVVPRMPSIAVKAAVR